MEVQELGAWLAFHQVMESRLNRWISRLLKECGSLAEAWAWEGLTQAAWLEEGLRQKLLLAKGRLEPERLVQFCFDKGIKVLTVLDKDYPQALLHISENPAILYYYGKKSLLDLPAVAVVGSRRSSGYGELQAGEFSRQLAEAGLCIVSGMARGIDSCAHRGALRGGGATLAVLGSGVDIVYPRENQSLYQEICQKGLVLSERPPGAPPAVWAFPARNRIISGLSRGVLLIEARAKSGALITSQLAAEQGREVWALPGPVTNPASIGPLQLIQDGARLVITPGDILRDPVLADLKTGKAGLREEGKPARKPGGESQASLFGPGPKERELLKEISYSPVHVDQLLALKGFSPGELYLGLTNLVRFSLIERLPGDYYQRI